MVGEVYKMYQPYSLLGERTSKSHLAHMRRKAKRKGEWYALRDSFNKVHAYNRGG